MGTGLSTVLVDFECGRWDVSYRIEDLPSVEPADVGEVAELDVFETSPPARLMGSVS